MENEPTPIQKPSLGQRYQLDEAIGTGGMAVVYHAWDTMLERPVAIKLLRQRYSRDERFRVQFHLEAKAAANLSHQNIVTIYDFGLDEGRLYIVMEFIPGRDLKSIIREKKRFSSEEAILLLTQACFGIGYAHRAGLIHCDIKPHNLLVYSNQRLKVTDFGIARLLATIRPDEQYDLVWGSPLYFSPEQASGLPPSPSSDVYSLGVILYEMLTGQPPFQSNDASELARMHRESPPIPPSVLVPGIPPALEQIVMKVLSKKPTDRYNNADQLGRILVNILRQQENQQPVANLTPPGSSVFIPEENSRSSGRTTDAIPTPEQVANEDKLAVDWVTIALGLIALVMAGGLIPFWLYIWLALRSSSL